MKRLALRLPKRDRQAKLEKRERQRAEGVPSGARVFAELLVVFSVILLCVTGYLWWHYIASNPKRVFTGMLNNALQTEGGQVRITQSSDTQTLDQTVIFNTAGQHTAHSLTVLGQSGNSATTETIGTPTADFIRYVAIKSDAVNASGKTYNYSALLNKWGKSSNDAKDTSGELYNQTVLGVIPFARLSVDKRAELLRMMEPTYLVDYKTVARGKVKGRPTYTYNVAVSPKAYVTMLKVFADDVGLTQLKDLKPEEYSDAGSLDINVTVDVWSRQLIGINYVANDRVERFGAFGKVQPPLTLPTKSIPIEQLQSQLQNLQ